MIIVLNGADFSQNNLGQVEITTVLDPFTEAAITASGNNSMSDIQKASLNTFFKKLGAFGSETTIWSKMQYVFLPMLSADLAHSMINYVGNSDAIVPDAAKFKLRNHGITGYDSTAQRIDVTAGTAVDLRDMSILYINTENLGLNLKAYIGSSSSARGTWGFAAGSNGSVLFSARYNTGSPSVTENFCTSQDKSTHYNKLGGYSAYGTTCSYIDAYGVVHTVTESSLPTGSSTTIRLFSALNGTGITQDASATGLLMIGTHLSSSEIGIVKTAAEHLRDTFVI